MKCSGWYWYIRNSNLISNKSAFITVIFDYINIFIYFIYIHIHSCIIYIHIHSYIIWNSHFFWLLIFVFKQKKKCYNHFQLFLKQWLDHDSLSIDAAVAVTGNVPLPAPHWSQPPSVWPKESSLSRCRVVICLYVGMAEVGRMINTLIMTSEKRCRSEKSCHATQNNHCS